MAWYDDPILFITVVLFTVGLCYLVYRILKEIWERL